jgi:hypothetical protein
MFIIFLTERLAEIVKRDWIDCGQKAKLDRS